MTRTYKKDATFPSSTNLTRHTNCRKLRKKMDRIDRRRLNRFAQSWNQKEDLEMDYEEIFEEEYEEDFESDYYEDWDNLEMGFDPYAGCYTDDC